MISSCCMITCSLHLQAVRSTSIHEIKNQNNNVVNIIWKHSQTANTRNKVQIIPTNSNSWYNSCVDSIIFITYDPCSLISLYWIPQYEIYEQVWEDMTIQDFENKTSNFRLKNKHDLRFDCFYSLTTYFWIFELVNSACQNSFPPQYSSLSQF